MSSFQERQGRYITLLGIKTVVTIRKSGILTLKFLESTLSYNFEPNIMNRVLHESFRGADVQSSFQF